MKKWLLALALTAGPAFGQVNTVPPQMPPPPFLGGTITSPLLAPQGCTSPGYAFTSAATSGMCLDFGQLSFYVGGAQKATMSSSVVVLNQKLTAWNGGTAASPSYAFTGETGLNSGFYPIGDDNIGFSAGGTLRWDYNAARILSTIPLLLPSGSNTAPSLNLDSSGNRGFYYSSGAWYWTANPTAALVLSTGGVGLNSDGQFTFSSSNVASAGADTGLARSAAGVVKVTDGGAGNGSLTVADGAAATPSYRFTSEPTSGFYHVGSGFTAYSANGGQAWAIGGAESILVSGSALNWSSSASNLSAGRDTGLARSAAGVVKVTDGSSGFGSLVIAVGAKTAPSLLMGGNGIGLESRAGGHIGVAYGGAEYFMVYPGGGSITAASGANIGWASGTDTATTSIDTGLARSAAGVVKVTNGSTGDGILQTALGVRGMNTKTVTDNSTTTVLVITLSRTNLQNFVDAEVQWGCYYRDDGPAVQVFRNQSHLTGVNNGGTVACAISSLSGVSSVTSGSLIGTLSTTTGTDVCNLRINCDSNLAGANPAFFAMYRLDQLGTYATLTPQ